MSASREAVPSRYGLEIFSRVNEATTPANRRLWALLRVGEGLPLNRKAVYRVLKLKGWFVTQRVRAPRPRVQHRRSRAERSNERWAMDVTHTDCGGTAGRT